MRTKFVTLATILLITASLIAVPAPGKRGRDKNAKAKPAVSHGGGASVDISIALGEYRRTVRDYVAELPANSLPPGLSKRHGALPQGLAKQLRKGGTLPPGLEKRLQPYPADLTRRLPQLGDSYEGGFFHGQVVIFNKRTSAIVDVFLPLLTE